MKSPSWLEINWVYTELRANSFHARSSENGVDLPVERNSDGRLTPACGEQIVSALRALAAGKSWLSRVKVLCAIPSRGLILRPLFLPATPPPELPRLLQLQIESEFPLPPEALAWGWIRQPTLKDPLPTGRQEVLLAAVRKEIVDDIAAWLSQVSKEVLFTPASLARTALVHSEHSAFALFDLGSTQSELTICEPGVPPTVRLLPWGENRFTTVPETADAAVDPANADSSVRLVSSFPDAALKLPLFLSGAPQGCARLASLLTSAVPALVVRVLAVPTGSGQTTAIAGMSLSRTVGGPSALDNGNNSGVARSLGTLLELRTKPAEVGNGSDRTLPRRSIAVAAALLAAVLLIPYVEALLLQPRLARRLAKLKTDSAQLATIDRELSFLQYLEQNQAPHLDAAFVVAQATPPGARVETLNINRQGEVSLSGWLRDPTQLGDFRLKLINSGFFSTVVVEDQSPTPDRQRINFRINARWKDATERAALTLGPELPDPSATKPGASNLVAGPTAPSRPPSTPPR